MSIKIGIVGGGVVGIATQKFQTPLNLISTYDTDEKNVFLLVQHLKMSRLLILFLCVSPRLPTRTGLPTPARSKKSWPN